MTSALVLSQDIVGSDPARNYVFIFCVFLLLLLCFSLLFSVNFHKNILLFSIHHFYFINKSNGI